MINDLALDVQGTTMGDLERSEQVVRDVERALEGGHTYESEYRLRRPDGSWSWTIARGAAVLGACQPLPR